jgi:hypothetical protein
VVSKRKQSWEIIKKARRMWPPSLDDILQLYDEAENLDPDYHLIFQDKARLFTGLLRREHAIFNYKMYVLKINKNPRTDDNELFRTFEIVKNFIDILKSKTTNPQVWCPVNPFQSTCAYLNLNDNWGGDLLKDGDVKGDLKEKYHEYWFEALQAVGGVFDVANVIKFLEERGFHPDYAITNKIIFDLRIDDSIFIPNPQSKSLKKIDSDIVHNVEQELDKIQEHLEKKELLNFENPIIKKNNKYIFQITDSKDRLIRYGENKK